MHTSAALLLALALVPGDSSQPKLPEDPTLSLTFGLYQFEKATDMYRRFLPVLEHLQGELEKELGLETDIRLRIFRTYEEGLSAIVTGEVDFSRLGPASYVMAHERNAQVTPLAMELKKGAKRFRGIIFVRADSEFRTLSDLRGRSFAFGDKNSTIGRFLAQAELLRAGMHAKDLGSYDYLGRHDKVAKSVVLGDHDAGSCKESTFKTANANKELRVLKSFENVTKPWVARPGLDPKVAAALRKSLLAMKDEVVLKQLKASGFAVTSDKEYEFVRKGMRVAEDFERTAK